MHDPNGAIKQATYETLIEIIPIEKVSLLKQTEIERTKCNNCDYCKLIAEKLK